MNFDNGFVDFPRGCGRGTLKICKVAGPGVAVGTQFDFTAPPGAVSVPAGPSPGGYCKVAGSRYPIGSNVAVTETGPAGYGVISIGVNPPERLVPGTVNLAAGKVTVAIGTGVTEVRYRNERRTGFLEICKEGRGGPPVTGDFSFTISPAGEAGPGPFIVPAEACTPAIPVPGGAITITEAPRDGYSMTSACSTIPADRQGACDPRRRSSTVAVAAGDVSTQTIAFVRNRRNLLDLGPGAAAEVASGVETATSGPVVQPRAIGAGRSSTTLACASHASAALSICTARVASGEPRPIVATGMVAFDAGGRRIALLPLKRDGSATLALPASWGARTLRATYLGDGTFGPSVSSEVAASAPPR